MNENMSCKKITISQIAKEANVSISTVSRVFNGNAPEKVGKDARRRVEEIIRKYDYKPNIHARGLASGKTSLIGVQMLSLVNPLSNVEMLDSITKEARLRGYNVVLGISEWDLGQEFESINTMLEKGVDGLIWLPVGIPDSGMIKKIKENKLPLVWLNKDCGFDAPASANDEIKSGRMAAEYLFEKGCKKPAFAGVLSDFHTNLRLEGWRRLMEEKKAGAACLTYPLPVNSGPELKHCHEIFFKLFSDSTEEDFDGLFVSGSEIACIAKEAMRESGGREFPLLGHNVSELFPGQIPVASIIPDNKGIGRQALELIMDLLEGRKVESSFFEPHLKV
jgi:LacI family transcriptional regulator